MSIDHPSFSTTGGPRVITVAEVLAQEPILNRPVDMNGRSPGRLAVYFHETEGVCTLYIANKDGNRWLRINSPR